ncbi:MAG TPA: formimidoylglutamate deiminase [Pyrinomonadaceae bacterium]|nr:formimidoylglutamate deiminase [Pyrinomonadaceae bacterium]
MSEDRKQDAGSGSGATMWVPDLLYAGGRFRRDAALVCDARGIITSIEPAGDQQAGERSRSSQKFSGNVVRLKNRALLPGLVNAHSHAFQRVIRGRTEYRSAAHARDSFWTWREMMYSAAARLAPEDIYDAARMAFLEMVLGGITAVGEFHYIHRTPEGEQYDDPNLLAKEVVRAARDAGLRIALLRVAYARSGFQVAPNDRQKRFIEPDAQLFLRHVEDLQSYLAAGDETERARSWAGVAPHSVRAVPLDYLRAVGNFAAERKLPLHMHVSEQPAEVASCLEETGRTPVALLADEGLLGPHFTCVHAVHITAHEIRALGDAGAIVCACPTTERNLGDGVVPADALLKARVPVALGTDSHTQIDLLEDARELEYHLRLLQLERNVLAPAGTKEQDDDRRGVVDGKTDESRGGDESGGKDGGGKSKMAALAARLFECATAQGARSVGARGGELELGRPADFFTVDLNDPTIAGAGCEDLLPAIIFSASRAAIRETVVGGRLVVEDGRHAAQDEIVARFAALQRKLWG